MGRRRRPRRMKTPLLLQMEPVECGAAALGSILSYHGKHVCLEELRFVCNVTRDGVKASSIIRAASEYALEGRGYKMEPNELTALDAPAILHWRFRHFVVYEGSANGRHFINDPEVGHRVVEDDEFKRNFTGVVLCLEPAPHFAPSGRRVGLLSLLRDWISGSLGATFYLLLLGLLFVFPGFGLSALSKVFVDDVLVKGYRDWIPPLFIGLVLTAVLRTGIHALQRYYLVRFQERTAIRSAVHLFWHTLRLPIRFFDYRSAGEVGSRLAVSQEIAGVLSNGVWEAGLNVVMVVAYGALMFLYDTTLALTALVAVVAGFVTLAILSGRIRALRLLLMRERGHLVGSTTFALNTIETVKADGAEDLFLRRHTDRHARLLNVDQRLQEANNALAFSSELIQGLCNGVLLLAGAWRVMHGTMTIGALVALQSLLAGLLAPVVQLVRLGGSLQEILAMNQRVRDTLSHPLDPEIAGDVDVTCARSTLAPGRLEVRGLAFGYGHGAEAVVEDINFSLEQGKRIALVGRTSSGKSTVAKLVCGLYTPWKGTILCDGRPRREFDRATLRRTMAFVDQNISLFEGTVRDNLTLWDDSISDDRLMDACRAACIDDLVQKRPGALAHVIHEGGNNVSGGERQRLEIARALALDPSILVLDEATSALDPWTEQKIMHNIMNRRCACVIVAHRLSTIRDCDEILVLNRGRIAARGKHADLLSRCSDYAQLVTHD